MERGASPLNDSKKIQPRLTGLIAALLVPRKADGELDERAFERNLETVVHSGVNGISIGGATGEYPMQEMGERIALMREVAAVAQSEGLFFVPAIGAAGLPQSLALGRAAFEMSAAATLLPPPLFFRYSQQDLLDYYAAAAAGLSGPVLIYNLPSFVSPVEPDTAVQALQSGIAGIKDSSGDLRTLEAFSRTNGQAPLRFVGNDSALLEALAAGVCDGCISGVAGVLPELLCAVCDPVLRPSAAGPFQELLVRADALPAPWALKVIARVRGWGEPYLPFPSGQERSRQIDEFEDWIRDNLDMLMAGSSSSTHSRD